MNNLNVCHLRSTNLAFVRYTRTVPRSSCAESLRACGLDGFVIASLNIIGGNTNIVL